MKTKLVCFVILFQIVSSGTVQSPCGSLCSQGCDGWPTSHDTPATWLESWLRSHYEGAQTQQRRCDYTFCPQCGGYIKFHDLPATWREAWLRCYYEGSVLASPIPELVGVMKTIIQTNNVLSGKVFTGISATYSPRDFSSVEGVPLTNITRQWAEGEPNNAKKPEGCVTLNQHGTLMDSDCNILLPFICFKKNKDLKLNNCGTTDNKYTLDARTGSCYKFHRFPHTWSKAYKICDAEGGYLAIINSDTEAQVIKEIFVKNPENSLPPSTPRVGASIGFKDVDEHSEWVTIQGQSLTEAGYDKFGPNLPDNIKGNQNCGQVLRTGLLDDVECEVKNPFICERDPNKLMFCDHKD